MKMPTIQLIQRNTLGQERVLCCWLGNDYYLTNPVGEMVHRFSQYYGKEVPEGQVVIDFSGISPHNQYQILVVTLEYQGQSLLSQRKMYLSHRGIGGLSISPQQYLRIELNSPIRDPNWERSRTERHLGVIKWEEKPHWHLHDHTYEHFLSDMQEIGKTGFKFGELSGDPWTRNMM
jgi:hypothetical protein